MNYSSEVKWLWGTAFCIAIAVILGPLLGLLYPSIFFLEVASASAGVSLAYRLW